MHDGRTTERAQAEWFRRVEALYAREFDGLVRLARRLVDTHDAAEDVVQEAFVRFAAVSAPPSRLTEMAYLRSIVLNCARSSLRARRVRRRQFPTPPVCQPLPEDAVLSSTARDEVRELLRVLPRRQRQVVELRHYADLSEREIADHLSISPGSVKTHASRATRALREQLDLQVVA